MRTPNPPRRSPTRNRVARVATAAIAVAAGALLLVPAAGAQSSKGTTVSVDDNFFKPKKLTVTVPEKVTWKWDGFVAHNVVVEKGPQKFKSKLQSEGTFTRVIKKPGVYKIHCTIHPGMTMKITADQPSTTSTTAAPPST